MLYQLRKHSKHILTDSLVILDDMIDDDVNDSNITKIFTEHSYHLKIGVVFIMQNIFHPSKKACTISLNTQYMVMFKNAETDGE